MNDELEVKEGEERLEARVLVLNENENELNEITSSLAENGYIVETARTSKEGLAKLSTTSFDVAVVDVSKSDGVEGIGLLRGMKGMGTRAIAVSEYKYNMREAFLEGALDVINRYDPKFDQMLLNRVGETVEKRQSSEFTFKRLEEFFNKPGLEKRIQDEQYYSSQGSGGRRKEEISSEEAMRRVLLDKIILFYDNQEERTRLEDRLRKEFNIITADNLDDALSFASTDVNLVMVYLLVGKSPSEMAGFDLVKKFQAVAPGIPVVLFHDYKELDIEDLKKRAREAEANDYVLISDDLEDRLKTLLGKAREKPARENYRLLVSIEDKRKQADMRRFLEEADYETVVVSNLDEAYNAINQHADPFDIFMVEYDPKQKRAFHEKLSEIRKTFPKEDMSLFVIKSDERHGPDITAMDVGVRYMLARDLVGQRNYTLPYVESAVKELEEKRRWTNERLEYEENKVIEDLVLLAKKPEDETLLVRLKNRLELMAAKSPNSELVRENRFKIYCRFLDQEGGEIIGGLEEITEHVVATQRIHVLRDVESGLGIIFKQYPNLEKVRLEASAASYIKAQNAAVQESQESLYSAELPVINSVEVISSLILGKGYTLTRLIKGPRLTSLVREMNYEINRGNKEAREFRKRFVFESNRYLAYLQVNPIPFPEDITPTRVIYHEDLYKTLTSNLRFLKTGFSEDETELINFCIKLLYRRVDHSDMQYFDMNWSNLLLETGREDSTLSDIIKQRRGQGTSINQYVRSRFHKIDWCKVDRKTNPLEDRRHESSQITFTPEERELYDFHFQCYKEKFELLRSRDSPDLDKARLDQIEEMITAIEGSGLERLEKGFIEANPVAQEIFRKTQEYSQDDALISIYRHMRWFDHTLNKYLTRAMRRKAESKAKIDDSLSKNGKDKFNEEKERTGSSDEAVRLERVVKNYVSKHVKANFIRTRKKFSYKIKNQGVYGFVGKQDEQAVHRFIDVVNEYIDADTEQKERVDDLRYYIRESIRLIGNEIASMQREIEQDPASNQEYLKIKDMSERLKQEPAACRSYLEALAGAADEKVARYGAAACLYCLFEKIKKVKVNYNRLLEANEHR